MQVIDARRGEWGEPLLLVDQIPTLESLRFRKGPARDDPAERGDLYVAEQDGYVDFLFQHDPDHSWHGGGFDGRQFRLHLDDGTVKTLVGPWSSNTDQVNRYLPAVAARQILLTDDPRKFQDAQASRSGAITAALWQELGHRFPAMLDQDAGPQRRSPQESEQRLTAGTPASKATTNRPAREAAHGPEHVPAWWAQHPEDQITTGILRDVLDLGGAGGIDPPPVPEIDDLGIA